MKDLYIRDKRSPRPKNSKVSRVMSANKARNTKPELLLRKALWRKGVRGYRLHSKYLPGSPDLFFSKKRLAVFIHGCYWHRCPHCNLSLPKHNAVFWKDKFMRNQERDRESVKKIKEAGYRMVVLWECKIKKDLSSSVREITSNL